MRLADGRRCFPGVRGEWTDDCRRRAQRAALQSSGREPGEPAPLFKIKIEAAVVFLRVCAGSGQGRATGVPAKVRRLGTHLVQASQAKVGGPSTPLWPLTRHGPASGLEGPGGNLGEPGARRKTEGRHPGVE